MGRLKEREAWSRGNRWLRRRSRRPRYLAGVGGCRVCRSPRGGCRRFAIVRCHSAACGRDGCRRRVHGLAHLPAATRAIGRAHVASAPGSAGPAGARTADAPGLRQHSGHHFAWPPAPRRSGALANRRRLQSGNCATDEWWAITNTDAGGYRWDRGAGWTARGNALGHVGQRGRYPRPGAHAPHHGRRRLRRPRWARSRWRPPDLRGRTDHLRTDRFSPRLSHAPRSRERRVPCRRRRHPRSLPQFATAGGVTAAACAELPPAASARIS